LPQVNFRLREFRLLEVSLKLDVDKSADLQEGVPLSFGVGVSCNYNKESKLLNLIMEISPEGEQYPCFLKVKGGAVFEFEGSPTQSQLDQCARINCPAVVFPFMREVIADLTRRAGLKPLYAPLINFSHFPEKDKKKKPKARRKAAKKKAISK